MQRSQRRSTKVCNRCRKRKTKCDFKFPACTPCKVAGAACLGFDPATRQPVPRSLVKSLEAQVAELEAQMRAYQAAPSNVPYLMASEVAQATISVGIPSRRSYLHSKISPALFFRPSCPPLTVSRDRQQGSSDRQTVPSIHRPQTMNQHGRYTTGTLINLSSVPITVITRMVQNYIDTHLPQYPFISQSMLETIVQCVCHEELRDSSSLRAYGIPDVISLGHFEYFVLHMILALSAMTLTWKDDDQARAASESFYNSAMKHLQALDDNSEIQALQISLLLAHYAHMCPERVDNWTCIANAIRLVLGLGLHQESPTGLDCAQVSERSRLFWVAYGMERSLCTNLRLPLSFPEEAIAVKLGIDTDDTLNFSPGSTEVNRESAVSHICRYRSLETEVHRVLHLEEDLHKVGSTSIQHWIEDITGRLDAWYQRAQGYTKHNMLEFKHVQFHHLIARIHRPTPRLRTRTPEDRRIVLNSALVLIEDYRGQEQRRRLFYPWHGVHILFETAVIVLDAWRQWNEASICADRLSPLIEKITAAFLNRDDAMLSLLNNESIAAEIDDLLFSDGPLTWNRGPFGGETGLGFEGDSDFFNSIMGEGFELFQWDPEWHIMELM
ncbi:uncharacterized protein N7459_009760 [Penicillium hispanicum]|uniref:uncharacterized protein n=1 Tax=Penicillium hispanicum TaxID=1080232 RepID=UPI0025412197|nr:uncharacterized protein N7459_009760 [Penicillium hispanicum]KAJ5570330.1 hypothetical protein N7459_009760 [Penicillium hispanicum]